MNFAPFTSLFSITLSAEIEPPCAAMMFCEILRPNPECIFFFDDSSLNE